MKTTKIIVEEAASSPEICGTFTFSQSSRKSEICVEEVASYSLNAPFAESVISDHKEASLSALIEEIESDHNLRSKISRGISIVSCSEDEKVVEKEDVETNDDAMEQLMKRIQKQRSILDNIITEEATKVEEENVMKRKESLRAEVSEVVDEPEIKESLTNGGIGETHAKVNDDFLCNDLETVDEISEVKEEIADIKPKEVERSETEEAKLEEEIIEEVEVVAEVLPKIEEKQSEDVKKASTVDISQVESKPKIAETSPVDEVKVPEKLSKEKVIAKEEVQPEGSQMKLISVLYLKFLKLE